MHPAHHAVEVGHEHETPSAKHGVEGMRVEAQRLGVGLDEFDVVQAGRVDSFARDREHPGRHVDGDDSSRLSDGARGGQRRLAAAGRDIEHTIAGAHLRQISTSRSLTTCAARSNVGHHRFQPSALSSHAAFCWPFIFKSSGF